MASKKKNKPKRSKLYRQTRKDIRKVYKPVLQGLGKQKDIAKQEAKRDTARVGSIYDNLAETFQPLNRQFNRGSNQILAGAGEAFQGISGEGMEGGISELLGAMGQNYAAMLGTGMQGTLGNIAGLQAGALANRADIESNVMSKYRDFVNDLSLQRSDLKATRAQALLDELNRRREMRLAQKEQKLRAEQFEKEFKFGKKQVKKEDKQERRGQRTAAEIARDRDADRAARRTARRSKRRIGSINEKISDVKADLAPLEALQGYERTSEVNERIAGLREELRRLQNQRKKARTKRKSAKRELRD